MSVAFAVRLSGILFLTCSALVSQTNLARITGAVHDQSGGAMPGVVVSVVDADRGLERSTMTDPTGQYLLPGLIPGRKIVKAEYQGFKSFEQANVVLEVAQDARLDIEMEPGAVNETVRVTEAPPLLDTTSAELGARFRIR